MNYLNVDSVSHITENLYLLKKTSLWLWILCYFFKGEDFSWDVYFYKTLDVHSGVEKTYALSSLENYKQFLYLLDNTKKVGTRILCEFSELSYWEKLQVLEGTKKIKWLAKTWLEQLEWKILVSSTVLSKEKYEEIRNYLSSISKDVKKIDSFLNSNMDKLQDTEKTELLNLFLKS